MASPGTCWGSIPGEGGTAPLSPPLKFAYTVKVKSKSKRSIAVSDSPHRYGNSHAIWDYTVLHATRQR